MELGDELRLDLPYAEFQTLKHDLRSVEFLSSRIFWDLRTIKSELEAEKIRTACKITAIAFKDFFGKARANMRVRDVLRGVYNCILDAGAQNPRLRHWSVPLILTAGLS